MIGTRWHLDDTIGRSLKFAKENPDTEPWTVVNFPALAEEDEAPWPESLGRKKGEALWPERYDVESLLEIRKQLGEYWFLALYQQTPISLEGGLFKRSYFNKRQKAAPFACPRVRYWDLASTEDGCNTVGT